jgi:hypothetical protein
MHSTGRHNCPIQRQGCYALTNQQGSGRSRPAMRAHPAPKKEEIADIFSEVHEIWHCASENPIVYAISEYWDKVTEEGRIFTSQEAPESNQETEDIQESKSRKNAPISPCKATVQSS